MSDPDYKRGPPLGAGPSASPWGYRVMITLVVCFTSADAEFRIHAGVANVNMPHREADIGIRTVPVGTAPAEESVLAQRVCRFAFAAYASHADVDIHGMPARPVRSLTGRNFIATGPWGPGDTWNERLDEPARVVMRCEPVALATAAVLANVGVAVLPCPTGEANSRLVRISEVVASWNLWVVTNGEARRNPRVQAVKQVIVEWLQATSDRLEGLATLSRRIQSRQRDQT